MNLKVVAEGVEDETTMRRVAALGCEQAQGYFLSKPLANTDMLAWLQNFDARPYGDRRGQQRAFSDPVATQQGRA
jgi:sensor c-di-GMP phosphodiesterase-like protein